jgi:hypothetical protein
VCVVCVFVFISYFFGGATWKDEGETFFVSDGSGKLHMPDLHTSTIATDKKYYVHTLFAHTYSHIHTYILIPHQ